MKLHLDFKPAGISEKINHKSKILLIGSCFSEHVGHKLAYHKFKVHSNPFGIVFNPLSMAETVKRILTKNYFKPADVFERNGAWFCFDAHSSITAGSSDALVLQLNQYLDEWYQHLKEAQYLVITFGSAYYYNYLQDNKVVANCHKLPQALFSKHRSGVEEIVSTHSEMVDQLQTWNPLLKIVYTVSPVKHLKDGVVENNLSKATLLLAGNELVEKTKGIYFPSYELVTDDLRDYRFYETDMAHPNQMAIDYVWQKFCETFFSEDTKALNLKIEEIAKAMQHRPMNAFDHSFVNFKKTVYAKTEMLAAQSGLDFSKELHYFKTHG